MACSGLCTSALRVNLSPPPPPLCCRFLDQSIGGAVATGTHGSSMRYGSLSSQA